MYTLSTRFYTTQSYVPLLRKDDAIEVDVVYTHRKREDTHREGKRVKVEKEVEGDKRVERERESESESE